MALSEAPRSVVRPPYLLVTDQDGLRHVIRVSAIQLASDGDLCRDSTCLVVAGRTLSLPVSLDRIIESLLAVSKT